MATIPTCRETRGARWKQWKLSKYEKPARPQMRRSTIRLIGHPPHRKRACTHDLTKQKTTISPSPLTREDQSLSQCLTREQRVKQDNTNLPRHSRVGGKPQGGCVVPGTVILASRQYPQGGRVMPANKTTPTNTNHMGNRLRPPM